MAEYRILIEVSSGDKIFFKSESLLESIFREITIDKYQDKLLMAERGLDFSSGSYDLKLPLKVKITTIKK